MKWSVLTLVGEDQSGIVAKVTDTLFKQGCNLAQASMMRLGANFTIMLRVSHEADVELSQVLAEICQQLHLRLHIDEDNSNPRSLLDPDVQVTVYGADRSGIVAQVTSVLAEAGLNIIDLETDIGGTNESPIYIMTMEGKAQQGIEVLHSALEKLDSDIEVNLDEINTLRG